MAKSWQPGISIRHLAFDVRNNSFTNILWIGQGGMLGRHRHRGPVSGYVLKGSWRYLEHDWVARPGDYVGEPPGAVHTLVSDDANGMKPCSGSPAPWSVWAMTARC